MRNLSSLLLPGLFIYSCMQPDKKMPDLAEAKDSLARTEKEFSQMSEKKGMGEAFVYYADEDVIKMVDGKYPIVGKRALRAAYTKTEEDSSKLSWEMVKVDVAKSADMGYTFGNWKFTTETDEGKDTTIYGNYVSVWKKQADGSWRYVVDGGTTYPQPKSAP